MLDPSLKINSLNICGNFYNLLLLRLFLKRNIVIKDMGKFLFFFWVEGVSINPFFHIS